MGPFKLLTLVFASMATASTFFSTPLAPTSEQVTVSTTVTMGTASEHTPYTVVTSFPNVSDTGMMTAISTADPTSPVECKGTSACVVTINGTSSTIYPAKPTDATTVVTSTFNSTDTYYSSATGTAALSGSARPSNGTMPVSGAGQAKVGVALGLAALMVGVIGA
jgi:hypothetical protein